jgi:hypothetical protein
VYFQAWETASATAADRLYLYITSYAIVGIFFLDLYSHGTSMTEASPSIIFPNNKIQ